MRYIYMILIIKYLNGIFDAWHHSGPPQWAKYLNVIFDAWHHSVCNHGILYQYGIMVQQEVYLLFPAPEALAIGARGNHSLNVLWVG